MPSEKNSLSGSELMLTKGNTAIEVPAGLASAAGCATDPEVPGTNAVAGGAGGMRPTHQNSPPPSSNSTVRIVNSRPLTRC